MAKSATDKADRLISENLHDAALVDVSLRGGERAALPSVLLARHAAEAQFSANLPGATTVYSDTLTRDSAVKYARAWLDDVVQQPPSYRYRNQFRWLIE
jgi:hypothetical protein